MEKNPAVLPLTTRHFSSGSSFQCSHAPQIFKNLWSSVINRITSLFKYGRGDKSLMMKGEMSMNSIQVRIDFDTKLKLMRDAETNKMTLSTLMRRLINLYLTDESVRQKVQ